MLVRVVLVLLVGLGLLGLVGAFLLSQQQAPPAPPPVVNAPPPAHILVSARAIRAGSLIVPEDMEAANVDQDKVLPGTMRDNAESRQQLRGAMMRRSLGAGEPFVPGDFLSPGDRGFLAAVLEPGMRAVTIGVDAVSGTAGLIWPGDRIDLLLTQSIDDQTLPTDHRVAGETLMEDVRVIAVDQQLVQGAQAGANGQAGTANRTVTLEVSPVDAERIEVAARLGRLSLAVHPAAQAAAVAGEPAVHPEPPQPVFAGDVSAALRVHGANKAATAAVRVFRGAGDPVEYKF
jgi:pilus assembly protein CpaB